MRFRHGLIALAAMLVPPGAVEAAALRVVPIRIEVDPGKQFCSLTVGNDADHPVTVQIRGFGWSRTDDGQDHLDPVSGPAVNPAITTLAGGSSRLVRCSLPRPKPGSKSEEQWRLLIDELPQAGEAVPAGSVQTLLRLSVPVFRTPAGAHPVLRWSRTVDADGTPKIRLSDIGTRRVQVVRLVVATTSGGRQTVNRSFYLLSSGSLVIPLAPALAHDIVSITAETDLGPLAVTADQQSPPSVSAPPAGID